MLLRAILCFSYYIIETIGPLFDFQNLILVITIVMLVRAILCFPYYIIETIGFLFDFQNLN